MRRRLALIAGWVVLGALLLTAPQFLGAFWVSNLVQILIFGLFALSVAFLVGHVGMLPLGHAAFFAAGAYGTAWLQVVAGRPVFVSILGGLFLALLLGFLFGFAVRTHGVYFLLVTLALGMVVFALANRWTSVTRGENGIGGVVLPVIGGINFAAMHNYYYVALAVVVISILGYYVMVRSPFGLALRGIRDSESRMRTLGYNVGLHKLAAFIISAAMAGLAGVLYVYWNNFVSPPTAGLLRSAEAKLAAIIGGPTTILGAWFGAGIITLIRNYLSARFDRYMTVMGLVFVAAALFFPGGLLGRRKRPLLRGTKTLGRALVPEPHVEVPKPADARRGVERRDVEEPAAREAQRP